MTISANDYVTDSISGTARGVRRGRFIGSAVVALMILAIGAGMLASLQMSRSAQRQNKLAIRAFDLHGDLRQIAGDLSLPATGRTAMVQSDIRSAVAGLRQSVQQVRSSGPISPLYEQAVTRTEGFLSSGDLRVALLKSASPEALRETSVAASTAGTTADLVDRAATEAETSADRAASDGRLGGLAALCFVICSVAIATLWRARRNRDAAVTASQTKARAQFEAMIENSSDLFFLTGANSKTLYCSPSAARFLGMSATEVCEVPLSELVHPDDLQPAADAFVTAERTGAAGPFDVRVRHADGGWRTLEFIGNKSRTASLAGVVWNTRDVTDRRALEEQLARQAFEDPLTGLANRALFRDRLGHAVSQSSRSKRSIAVLMLDLDGFKAINDSLGHDAGDEALQEIAARISGSARPGDTIARLGGDEFTVLLEDLDDVAFADEVADRILDLVRQPLLIKDASLQISASIGVATSGSAGVTAESLLRDADIAMYAAKAGGRDRRARFHPVMHVRANEQLRLSQDLARALDRHEFVVYYQPSVSLDGGRPEGVEALIRWNHPENGIILPDEFIPIVEQSGLIVPIGRWVLEQACAQAMSWQSEFGDDLAMTMSVNVSGRQLSHDSLIPDVRRILASSGLDPGRLILEVTESVLMSDIDLVTRRLEALRKLGVSIAIDDFGTGYSSLAYLRSLPIDILKIDKTFVDAASAGDPGGDAILRAIVDLSSALRLKTIAEGVEDAGQAGHVKELGCQAAQGFLYFRPMPPEDLRSILAASVLERHLATTSR